MKKIICIILAALFLISVAVSCADNKTDEQTTANTSRVPTTPAVSSTPAESSSVPVESTTEPAVTEAVTTVPPETKPAEVTISEPKPVVTQVPATEAPVTEPAETTPPALVIPESGGSLGENLYFDPFNSAKFSNVNELYSYMKNMSEKEFDEILAQEQMYLWDTARKTHISQDELKYGIFGYLKNSILNSGTVASPCVKNSKVGENGYISVRIKTDPDFRKPVLEYTLINGLWVEIIKIDSELATEAVDKGAAWLVKEICPGLINLHNYEQIINDAVAAGLESIKQASVYENKYTLGDRTVNALVYDNSKAELGKGRQVRIYFAYEDMLVCVLGQPEDIYEALPGLTFEEVKVES